MRLADSWELMCESTDSVPTDISSTVLRPIVAQAIGKPVSAGFSKFSAAFPLTAAAMDTHWGLPVLLGQRFRMRWQLSLALRQPQQTLFFDLGNVSYEAEGEQFEAETSMLPQSWKELYRFFWSFGVTDKSLLGLHWINTPFSWSSRLDPASYSKRFGGSPRSAKQFQHRQDSSQLRCWLATSAGDALWLDELKCDRRVLHVKSGNYEDAVVIAAPGEALDRYLGYYLSGGEPANFDFRSGSQLAPSQETPPK